MDTFPTRAGHEPENVRLGLVSALALHATLIAVLAASTYLFNRVHPHWGSSDPVAGSISANMVNALPLPPRQRTLDHAVLTSEHPSIAPTPTPPTPEIKPKSEAPKPKADAPLRPNEIAIPQKPTPTKTVADHEQPKPVPVRPAPPTPPTTKATTGDSAGIQIPQSVSQLKNGTASITVEERAFGNKNAYYVQLISQKVDEGWQHEQTNASAQASNGKRATVTFTIIRDGSIIDSHLSKRSGSPSLDTAALRSIQRIDTFGPLPEGDHITIDFSFDFHAE